MRKAFALALTLTLAFAALRATLWTPTGFLRAVYPALAERGVATLARTISIDDGFLREAHAPRRFLSARWRGVWMVPESRDYTLYLGADDWAVLSIDGERVLERGGALGFRTRSVTRRLAAGPHLIALQYEQHAGGAFLAAGWSPAGEAIRPFGRAHVFPEPPSSSAPTLNRVIRLVGSAALAAWAIVGLMATARMAQRVRARAGRDLGRWRGHLAVAWGALQRRERWLSAGALALVLLLGGALRLDAILVQYGPFERPSWLHEVEVHALATLEAIRPDIFGYRKIDAPYVGGDPVNYIRFAREMTSFYAAHVREPVFPFATRLWLGVLDGQDVAVSFASASFSVLAVGATWWLGRAVGGAWVGVIAALGLAIDKDMVSWAADGWRDDAGTFFVVALSLAFLRLWQGPSWAWTCAAGVLTAGALLTRVALLSLIAPALLLAGLAGNGLWRPRVAHLAVVVVIAVVLAAPYFVNCWRVYGDPLYAVNYHTTFYRARAGDAYDQPMSAGSYLRERLRRDPAGTVTTGLAGVTTHPFGEKWRGFDFWVDGLGRVMAWLSLAGLVLLASSRAGAFLLTLLVGSLVPYAFTWTIPGGAEWRFTMHAYPLYLTGAALAIVRLWGGCRQTAARSTATGAAVIRPYRFLTGSTLRCRNAG